MISDDHHQKTLMFNPSSTNKNMASSSTTTTTTTDQQQQALKCPRCDSSNTKFCYYNNYSLSQPRHFCKACKRYWTRGGTLRNVPVGGGCRKNKRLKRPSSSSAAASSALDAIIAPPNSHIDLLSSSASNHHHHQSSTGHIGSLLYAHHDMISLPFSRYDAMSAVQPQLSALGLDSDSYQNGLIGNNDNNNSILSSYGSIFGGASSTPTIASLLASKFASNNSKEGLGSFQALPSFEELNEAGMMSVNSGSNNKHVKLELDGNGRSLAWINAAAAGACNNSATSCYDHQNNNNNHTDQIVLSSAISSDPSLYWTNPTAVVVGGGNWLDPTANIGSNSVPSLI